MAVDTVHRRARVAAPATVPRRPVHAAAVHSQAPVREAAAPTPVRREAATVAARSQARRAAAVPTAAATAARR